MNYKFANLLGAPYRGGNILFHGNELLSPVGNRVSQVNLAHSTSQTLPFENLNQVRTLCLSPDGQLLLSIDEQGRALLIARTRRVLLHHFSFKGPVTAAAFSPDGKCVAVAVGKLLQVWHSPGFDKQLSPMQLLRTYGTCHDTITDIDWSADGQFIAAASKDLTARVYSLNPIPGWTPPTLAGHKDALVGVFFTIAATQQAAQLAGQQPVVLYTVSKDGALFGWSLTGQTAPPAAAAEAADDDAEAAEAAEAAAGSEQQQQQQQLPPLAQGGWVLSCKHFFMQRGARLSAADYHRPSGVLVVGFSNGLFELYQLPEFQVLQTLSVSHERISTAAFNAGGDWLALGCAKLGQLLVWEWRSEGYVLRQQGHYFDVSCACYSPDGAIIATGADDSKVKLYQLSSGFCYVTFSEHSAPVSALAFLPTGAAVVSASLDGTVRAFDLLRYRNFRTFTAPSAVQFISLAVENSGEVVAAGSQDDFQIYVWSVKTGRLLDVLAGHEGPVSGLAFCPTQPLLASCSWDKTVRTWDVYDNKSQLEVLQHSHDVLALAWRPDGKQLASATLDGQIYFWNAQDGVIEGVIEGRRDIRGGRLASDRRSAGNLSSGAAFTSLTFSADGSMLFAGGRSKYVCVYDVAEKVLLRRFQVTHNRSLDGVLDQLNSKHMTDAGPLQLIQHEDADSDDELLPAGGDPAAAADVPGTASRKRAVARTRALALSPTGATWAAATTEGLLLYALDAGLNFDPTDLTEALTPQAFHAALAGRAYVRALLIALRLGDPVLLKHGLMSVPPQQVTTAAAQLPALFLQAVLSCVAECLDESPHMEYLLSWVKALLIAHGPALAAAAGGGTALRAALAGGGDAGAAAGAAAGRAGAAGGGANLAATLRALRQVVTRLHKDLSSTAEGNVYLLDYIVSAGQLQQQQRRQAAEQQQQQDEDGGAAAMLVDAAAAVSGQAKTAAAKKAGKKQRKQQKQVLQ
uniref:Small-subunit processome Utp12 domain-containing protein n=1 Tax=Tetradesmus obliquus TaxID=3088 RepID=A0A383VAW3_TETOB|eukprot:jgi/Sobl393_1/11061/SZX62080.1